MNVEYQVSTFIPKVKGCGTMDMGWDDERCAQYEAFLNKHAKNGWKLHSSEYREVTVKGCAASKGIWLVCVFEKIS